MEQLYDHNEKSELGQRFISYLNRAKPHGNFIVYYLNFFIYLLFFRIIFYF